MPGKFPILRSLTDLWRAQLSVLLVMTLVGSLTLTVFRFLMWWDYHPSQDLPVADLARAFGLGARFDLKALSFFALIAVLLLVIPSVLTFVFRAGKFLGWIEAIFVALIFAFIDLLALINHFYIDFYGTEINTIIFGLFEDDTHDILVSVWNDYPILALTLTWILLVAIQCYVTVAGGQWLATRISGFGRVLRFVYPLLAVFILMALTRGSLGSFPLREMHMTVARDNFINMLVPNGPYALRVAYKARRNDQIRRDPLDGLQIYGFDTPQQAALAYGLPDLPDDALQAALYRRTPRNHQLESQPPHVVVALMEAFGQHIMTFHQPGNDVLGRFARHANQDFLFHNFVSINHGTHPTLEGLLFNTPITPLTSAGHGFYALASSAVLPYRRAGYRTVFLTSGPANWRGLDDVLRRQGFDEVIDDTLLKLRYPDAEEITWGIPDEYMFRYALERLEKAEQQGQPLFLFLLSTSNHTPYDRPESYRPGPLNLDVFKGLNLSEPDNLREVLESYQYATDALGGFLDRIKTSELADQTLVAVTGDHSTRHFVEYSSDYELPMEYGVPLYLYLPKMGAGKTQYDPARFGGHRDLFPTLYRHSLSEACYFASGHDLLSDEGTGTALAGFQYAITAQGAVTNLTKPSYLVWKKPYTLLDETPPSQPIPELLQVAQRERGYVALLDWNIRKQVLAKKSLEPPCAPAATRTESSSAHH